jgi:7-cyano-7-deazaguanine synthase in queuosine biosynthesis
MQTIIHEKGYKYINSIFNDIEHFYSMTSVKENTRQLVPYTFDSSFTRLSALFSQFGGVDYTFNYIDKKYVKLSKIQSGKNIIVCFSGGKDSLTTALHYKETGWKVYLYHVTGVNKTYYDEHKYASKLAEMLELPIIIEDISYKGNHEWTEHPMKNMVIASMALNYGIKHNITTKIAFGNFNTSSLYNDEFGVCGGDCKEMWQAYESIINTVLTGFKIYRPNRNYQTAFNKLLKYPNLIEHTISCLTPNRFREQFRQRTMAKYGYQLSENRCGCCWKCAVEYIQFTDNNIFSLNPQYYIYCLEILCYTIFKESGRMIHNVNEVWNSYFFYPMSKSKMKGVLYNATIRSGKIKYFQ